MGDLFIDFLLPKTDRGAVIQWLVMGTIWLLAIGATWRLRREYRQFVVGLALVNLAWFAARTVH